MPRLPTTTATLPDVPEWTYELPGTPTFGDVDVVRTLLQDTDPRMPLIEDAVIQWHLDEWMPRYDSPYMVAAQVAERIAAKFAGVVTVSGDGVSVAGSDLQSKYTALATELRATHKEATIGGEVDISNLMWDPTIDWSIAPLSFGVGMHDNIEAGRQDYGSHRGRAGGYGPYADDTVRPG